jgi:hypothetical protein
VNAGTTMSTNALAVDVGGGLEVRLNRRFALRVLRASYLYTQFPNTTTNVQSRLSLGARMASRLQAASAGGNRPLQFRHVDSVSEPIPWESRRSANLRIEVVKDAEDGWEIKRRRAQYARIFSAFRFHS